MLIKNNKLPPYTIRAYGNNEHYTIDNVMYISSTCNIYIVKCVDGFKYFFDKKTYTIEYGILVQII